MEVTKHKEGILILIMQVEFSLQAVLNSQLAQGQVNKVGSWSPHCDEVLHMTLCSCCSYVRLREDLPFLQTFSKNLTYYLLVNVWLILQFEASSTVPGHQIMIFCSYFQILSIWRPLCGSSSGSSYPSLNLLTRLRTCLQDKVHLHI